MPPFRNSSSLRKFDTDEKIPDMSMTNNELGPIQALSALGKSFLELSGPRWQFQMEGSTILKYDNDIGPMLRRLFTGVCRQHAIYYLKIRV